MNEVTYLHCFWFIVSYGWEMFKEMHSRNLVFQFVDAYCNIECCPDLYISDYNLEACMLFNEDARIWHQ